MVAETSGGEHELAGGSPGTERASEPLLIHRLLERVDAFRVLRENDEHEAHARLEALGIDGVVEADMVAELGAPSVLAHPDQFLEAHAAVMKGLEVLDRNRARQPALRLGGPLRPVASALVGQLAKMQIEGHERKVLRWLAGLYRRREAQTVLRSPEHLLLSRACRQVDRSRDDVAGGGAALTKLLLGGAAVSVASTAISSVLDAINASRWIFAFVTVLCVAIALGACWVILQSAAVARRRIRIALDEPLHALYETIGDAGSPPHDPTRHFVFFSLVALAVGWIVVPVAVGVVLWPS